MTRARRDFTAFVACFAIFVGLAIGASWLTDESKHDPKTEAAADAFAARMGDATKACLFRFRKKFGDASGKDFVGCMSPQEHEATQPCTNAKSDSEFVSCVVGGSIRVMDTCDLSKC